MEHNKPTWKDYLLLHSSLLLYSTTTVFSKIAAEKEFLSLKFILFYGLMLFILVVYAVLWQQILKRFPLTLAFANKSVVIVWGILWGALLFQETITWQMIVGAIIIIIGVITVVTDDE